MPYEFYIDISKADSVLTGVMLLLTIESIRVAILT